MAISRLLVIGLDGATFDVLLPLIQDGTMPNLAALMHKGCWGNLSSTTPPFTAAAWSTAEGSSSVMTSATCRNFESMANSFGDRSTGPFFESSTL